MEKGGLTLLNRLVDGRDADEGTALDSQVVAGAVVPHRWRAVGKDDLAVVPSLVGFSNGSQVDGGAAELRMVFDQVQSSVEQLIGRGLLFVPREYLLVLLESRKCCRENVQARVIDPQICGLLGSSVRLITSN